MMRSLFSAVSGLKNHQTRMDVIGNNIANVNTIGFKGSRVTFQDTLSQTLQGASGGSATTGGSNPMQIGLGMGVASVDTVFTPGSPQPTGNPTDLCLNGQGFFAIQNGRDTYYTRAGNFNFDTSGNFVVPGTGEHVMGYLGNVDTGVIDRSAIVPIKIPTSATVPAKATDALTIKANLSDKDAVGTREFATTKEVYDAKGNAYSVDTVFAKPMITSAVQFNGATLDNTSTTPSSQQIYVGDKNGVLHALTIEVTPNPAASPQTWDVAVKENGATLTTLTGQTLAQMNSTGLGIKAGDLDFTLTYPGAGVGSYKAGTVAYTDAEPIKTTSVSDSTTLDDTLSSTHNETIKVLDDRGVTRNLNVTIATATGPTWNITVKDEKGATITTLNSQSVADMTTGTGININDGKNINFNLVYSGHGTYAAGAATPTNTAPPAANTWYWAANSSDSGMTVTSPLPPANKVTFTQNGGYSTGGGNLPLSFTNGANSSTLTVDMTGLTQFSSATSVTSDANGYSDGKLNNTVIDSNGVIVGKFTNGQERNLGQVVTMMCDNPGGLTKVGDNLYSESSNSGKMDVLKDSTMTVGALEMSNVDLSSEFSNMIITERGFQANSKIITVADEMLQDLTNLKR
ncbi:MAG: flagellar hook-basal body complex protein [Veillonellales bacterium]